MRKHLKIDDEMTSLISKKASGRQRNHNHVIIRGYKEEISIKRWRSKNKDWLNIYETGF